MSNRGKTLLRGHTLPNEGRVSGYSPNGIGRARCSCGEYSKEELPNTAARKRWHREHKIEVIQDGDA